MAEERGAVPPEAPRRTMYQLLYPTQSSIPSCIMFPPNAPHNVIETAKLRFFPFSLKDKAKGWLYTLKPRDSKPRDRQFVQVACGGGFLQKEPEDAMDYLDEIAENSNTWNGPSPLDSTDQNRSSTTTSGGSVFRLREEDNMSAKISLLTKGDRGTQAEGKPPLKDVLYTFIQKQGEQNQRFETMFTRIDEKMRETKSQVAKLTETLSRTERGKLLSQTQPNPNNQSLKVVNTGKFEEVKSITILRSGKEIGKGAPKANEKSKETPAKKDESGIAKSNDIEKCPFHAPFPQALKLSKNLGCHQAGKCNHPTQDPTKVQRIRAALQSLVLLEITMIECALLDLGASVNLLPFFVYLQLGLGELKPTSVTLQLANRSVSKPRGVVEDVLVKVENFYYLVDFIILDIEPTLHPSANIPIILGRPFLATANALINCRNGRMKITFGSMTVKLNIFNVNPQQLVDEECEYMLEEEQVVVVEKPLRSKKKSLLAYPDAPKLKLKQPPRDLPCASIEPHAISFVEVPSKMSVDQGN
uniref:Retrotransposon gag domain-containing protein n=1 Tax=Fagus sylvatica TaxID=28930 RepID=A0A2N9GV66_FAGSY